MLPQDKQSFLLELFRGIAIENLLNLGQCARFVLAHHRVQRQQLHVVALAGRELDGLAAPGANLNLQRAALIQPAALGIVASQLGAGRERMAGLAQLVLGIGLPIEGSVGVLVMHAGDPCENGHRVGPAAFVDGARSIRVQTVVRHTGRACVALHPGGRDGSRKSLPGRQSRDGLG